MGDSPVEWIVSVATLHRLSVLLPPLAGEGWGGGELARVLLRRRPASPPPPRGGGGGGVELARVLLRAPSLSLPRRRGRGRFGASDDSIKSSAGYSTTGM